jgi:hypothetical protein
MLPKELVGVVQLAITRLEGPTAYHHLRLDGRRTCTGDGIAEHVDTWVESSDGELSRLLLGETATGALRAAGNLNLLDGLWTALVRAPRAQRTWQRGGR